MGGTLRAGGAVGRPGCLTKPKEARQGFTKLLPRLMSVAAFPRAADPRRFAQSVGVRSVAAVSAVASEVALPEAALSVATPASSARPSQPFPHTLRQVAGAVRSSLQPCPGADGASRTRRRRC